MAKSIQQQLKDLFKDNKKVLQLRTDNGDTIENVLKSQAKILLYILEEEIEKVYAKPQSWYKRSNDFRESLDKTIAIDPKTNTITIGFLEDKAWHDSWITKTYNSGYSKQAFVPQGIREGFEIFDSGNYVDGIDFVQNAVNRFNKIKKPWITVDIDDSAVRGNWWK